MSDLVSALLALVAFLVGGHLAGRFYLYRQIFVYHNVDPKFQKAPDIQYQLSLLGLGFVLVVAGVCFVFGSLISLHWQRGWVLSPWWSLLIGASFFLLFFRAHRERDLSWPGVVCLIAVSGVTGFFSCTGVNT